MAALSIIIAPDSRLKGHCEPVERVDKEVRKLMDGMLDAMHKHQGIGLAAPQVGVLKRVIVIDMAREGEEPAPMRIANPEIVWTSEEEVLGEEGCLSLPQQFGDVVRPKKARVRYLDQDNQEREIEAEDMLARCILHEMDHLEGILFVDHISALKRNIILRKLTKMKKLMEAAE